MNHQSENFKTDGDIKGFKCISVNLQEEQNFHLQYPIHPSKAWGHRLSVATVDIKERLKIEESCEKKVLQLPSSTFMQKGVSA